MFSWEKAQPEAYGIPTDAAAEFEKQVLAAGVHLHGFIFLQGRKILAEKYYEPYGQESLHRMYSVTKSFAALAVGLLEKEGKIKLGDRICDYFPEYTKDTEIYPWCEEMTIEDMLSMRTCYGSTTYKIYDSKDWTKSFFRVEPDHIPGTVFSYDTSSSHTLAALVEKLTGKKLLDYLRDEALREMGFSEEAYIIPDGVGVSQGGSGMMSTLRDVACAAYLCNHYGGWRTGSCCRRHTLERPHPIWCLRICSPYRMNSAATDISSGCPGRKAFVCTAWGDSWRCVFRRRISVC